MTPQKRDPAGKWKRATNGRYAQRWRARCYYRDGGGVMRELSRFGSTRADAERSLEQAFEDTQAEHVDMTADMPFVAAGRLWLERIARTDSGLSDRTRDDYRRTFERYVDTTGSTVRGLTLREANNPQRLRRFLQRVADERGTASARVTRSVLTGILKLAVDNGVQASNAIRQVGQVAAQKPRKPRRKCEVARDTTRAFTRAERDAVVTYADALVAEDGLLPQTVRKRQAVADLAAFLAGTGARITEARRLLWEHVHLDRSRVEIFGTKSRTSDRALTLPDWLAERLRVRAEATGGTGYVFGSPHHTEPGSHEWDQSNCAKAVAAVLSGAGYGWATPHTFRRTVATLAHAAGAPLVDIADQLGHANPSMTANVYLGRDPFGERASVADYL